MPVSAETEAVLGLMRDSGAVACGQMLTGLGSFALVRGAQASRELTTRLQHHVGYFGGTVLATIIDNQGARHVVKNRSLAESDFRV